MIVKKTMNLSEIKKVILNPWVFDRITDDKCSKEFELPVDGIEYIGAYWNDEIIGLGIYHDYNGRTKFHFQVLPEYKHLAGFALKKMLRKNISIEIPEIYQDVISFAKRFGFRPVDTKPNAHLKNGGLSNTVILEY